jgi:hypothetical protein
MRQALTLSAKRVAAATRARGFTMARGLGRV